MTDYFRNAKPLERAGIIGLVLVIIAFVFLFTTKTTAYSVYVDGEEKFCCCH